MIDKLAKLNASQAADQTLDRMVSTVNNNFKGGKVTKTQLLSWIVIHFEKQLITRVESIRKEHFDAVAHLENILKDAKRSQKNGEINQQLRHVVEGISNQYKKSKLAGCISDEKPDAQ